MIRYSVDYGAQAQYSNKRAGGGGASHAAIDYDIELGERSRLGSKGSRRLYIILQSRLRVARLPTCLGVVG